MWDDDDRRSPTPQGISGQITITFAVSYAYNMTRKDLAKLAIQVADVIEKPIRLESRKYELDTYGSLSETITFKGVQSS